MKISKSISRRIAVLMSALCFFATAQLVLTTAQTLSGSDHSDSGRVKVIGTIGLWLDPNRDDLPVEPLTLRASADGVPEVKALPRKIVAYSVTGSLPDDCRSVETWRRVVLGVRWAVTLTLVVMLLWLLAGFLRGTRTGDVFRPSAPRMMRWMALLVFIYCTIEDNFHIFDHFAVKHIIAETPFADVFFGMVQVSFGSFLISLCMLVLAEVLTVGCRLNEEESLTL